MTLLPALLVALPSVAWAGFVTISNVVPRRDNFGAILDAHDSKLNLFEGRKCRVVGVLGIAQLFVLSVLQECIIGMLPRTVTAPSLKEVRGVACRLAAVGFRLTTT
jgi:hypothetical protein